VCLSLSFHLSIRLCVSLSIFPFVRLAVRLSVCMSVYLFVSLSVCLAVPLCLSLSVHLSVCPTVTAVTGQMTLTTSASITVSTNTAFVSGPASSFNSPGYAGRPWLSSQLELRIGSGLVQRPQLSIKQVKSCSAMVTALYTLRWYSYQHPAVHSWGILIKTSAQKTPNRFLWKLSVGGSKKDMTFPLEVSSLTLLVTPRVGI